MLNEGTNRTDDHTAKDGTQFVQVPTGHELSRRVVIGQDPYIPAVNSIQALAWSHQGDAEQGSQTAAEAEQSVAGYGSLNLAELRQSQAVVIREATDAQKLAGSITAYKAAGHSLDATQLNQLQRASTACEKYSELAREQSDEIDARGSTIVWAQQQRTASMGAFGDAQLVHNQIQAAR